MQAARQPRTPFFFCVRVCVFRHFRVIRGHGIQRCRVAFYCRAQLLHIEAHWTNSGSSVLCLQELATVKYERKKKSQVAARRITLALILVWLWVYPREHGLNVVICCHSLWVEGFWQFSETRGFEFVIGSGFRFGFQRFQLWV